MQTTRYYLSAAVLGLAAILTLGCDNSTGPATPTLGAVQIGVWTTTSNIAADSDGYALIIDGGLSQPVAINVIVTIRALPWGRHLIVLDGVASHCSVRDTNLLWVDVNANKPLAAVNFYVSCIGEPDGNGDWDY